VQHGARDRTDAALVDCVVTLAAQDMVYALPLVAGI